MATQRDKYYGKMLKTLVDYNDRNNAPLFNEKHWQEIGKVMSETQEEDCNIILYTQNVTMDIFFQSPIMTNTQRDNENMILTLEGIINFYALAETLKGLTIK